MSVLFVCPLFCVCIYIHIDDLRIHLFNWTNPPNGGGHQSLPDLLNPSHLCWCIWPILDSREFVRLTWSSWLVLGLVDWMMISNYLGDQSCLLSRTLLYNQMFFLQISNTPGLWQMKQNQSIALWSISPVQYGEFGYTGIDIFYITRDLIIEWIHSLDENCFYHIRCRFQWYPCAGYDAKLS